jgi:predicted transcriptional regulator
MPKSPPLNLSRRERQIMDVVYRRGEATAADVAAELPDPPTYTTVRGLLRILEEKGHLRHREEGTRYVYFPSTPRDAAGHSVLAHVVRTFFDGSPARAMAALLGSSTTHVPPAELDRLAELVARARAQNGPASADGAGEPGSPAER